MSDPQTTEPDWSEAEEQEILRLHIIDGLIIDNAIRRVFEQRESPNND